MNRKTILIACVLAFAAGAANAQSCTSALYYARETWDRATDSRLSRREFQSSSVLSAFNSRCRSLLQIAGRTGSFFQDLVADLVNDLVSDTCNRYLTSGLWEVEGFPEDIHKEIVLLATLQNEMLQRGERIPMIRINESDTAKDG